jgi:hypothetical protein
MYFNKKAFSSRYGTDFFTFEFIPFNKMGTQIHLEEKASNLDSFPPGETSMWHWVTGALGIDCCSGVEAPYIEHKMEVRCGNHKYVLTKRYTDFQRLKDSIQSVIPQDIVITSFNTLPPKTYFEKDFSDDFIRTRHEQLSAFLEDLLAELSQKGLIKTNNLIKDFFELPSI